MLPLTSFSRGPFVQSIFPRTPRHIPAYGHRNTSFQPLPRPLGLPPYHYSLTDNFPAIAANLDAGKKMVLHVMGDSGGVQDGEFQNNVAQQMIKQVAPGGASVPQFCYHVGDVVYFTGMNDDYYAQFYDPYAHYTPPILVRS